MIKREQITGCFDKLSDEEKEFVKEIAAHFHFRTGEKQYDGSFGEVRITIKELNDCIAIGLLNEEKQ